MISRRPNFLNKLSEVLKNGTTKRIHSKINFGLYVFFTKIVSLVFGAKEMKIAALKA